MTAAALTIDVGPMLDEWLKSPTQFAEQVVFQRPLSVWEKQAVIDARWRLEIAPDADRIEALKFIGAAMRAAVGSSSHGVRKRRKRQHLKTLRSLRAYPETYVDLRYRHRFIRARCGKCRALYAFETFISFVASFKNGPARRMYTTEHENILDCGHPSLFLYPVEWEADGYVFPIEAFTPPR